MNELSTNKTNKPSKQKKWTHLQKYEESVGKFQSLLTKCSIKAQKQPHSNQNQSNFSQNQSNIKQTLIFKLISSIEKVSEVIGVFFHL